MKTHIKILSSVMTLCALSACKPGFNLTEQTTLTEETADKVLLGATSDGTWKFLIDEDNNSFTLQKFDQPDSETTEESLNGTYSTESDGWVHYLITSTLPTEITNASLYALELADAATIVMPFYNNNQQWVPLVEVDGCPTSNVAGNAILLERPSNATRDDIIWLGPYNYDVSTDDAVLTAGYALDNMFNQQSALTQNSDNCDDGYVKRSDGNHYLGKRATFLEMDDSVIEGGETRLLSLPARSINALTDADNQSYIGLLREFSSPEDSYRVTAECTGGVCEIYEGTDADDRIAINYRYTLTLNDDNRNYDDKDGLITGTLQYRVEVRAATNVLCMVNTDVDNSSASNSVIACTAQAPNNTETIVQLILSAADS